FRSTEYETALLNALAEDRGPDIMSIHNDWTRGYQNKLVPLPDTYTIPFTTIEGSIKKEKITTLKTIQGLTVRQLKNQFVDVVADDVIMAEAGATAGQTGKDRIYALPLSADNMVLFYNKNLLNAAGIAESPKFWTDFQTA